MKRNLSVSQAETFQTCSYKWQLKYQRGLSKDTVEADAMSLGSLVHDGLAAALFSYADDQINSRDMDTDIALVDAKLEIETLGAEQLVASINELDTEKILEFKAMLQTAILLVRLTIEDIDIPKNYNIVLVDVEGETVPLIEHWLEYPVENTDFIFRGIVDAVLEDKNDGTIEVVDWKTRAKFSNDTAEQLKMQIGIYQYMLEKMYGMYVPMGTIYQIKSELSKSPIHNADGSLNKTRAKYQSHKVVSVIRNREIQKRLWFNLVSHATRIYDITLDYDDNDDNDDNDLPRAYGMPCSWCEFRDICYAELHGYDADSIIKSSYKEKE